MNYDYFFSRIESICAAIEKDALLCLRIKEPIAPATALSWLDNIKAVLWSKRAQEKEEQKYNAVFQTRCGCERKATIDRSFLRPGEVYRVALKIKPIVAVDDVNAFHHISTMVRDFRCDGVDDKGVCYFMEVE